MSPSDLVAQLVAAQRSGAQTVDQSAVADLDRSAAYSVQRDVMTMLGAAPGVIKTAVQAGGVGVAAPIYAANVGPAGAIALPLARIAGLEVEVGLVLARDVASCADVDSAIDHFFVGIEVCGTRFLDRKAAAPNTGLADNMSAFGYVIGGVRAGRDRIEGLDVELQVDGQSIYKAAAKHGFGAVLASLLAYADNQVSHLPLRAGTVITTGSLCGLVPVSSRGRAIARLGNETVAFEID